jgi:hypothetical protein
MEMLGVMHAIPPEFGIYIRRYTVEISCKSEKPSWHVFIPS